jgi:putative protease
LILRGKLMTRKRVKPELLAPAGSLEKCKIAFLYGADAVYLGGKQFGLRAFADNFSMEELQEAVTFAHNLQKKVYVTVNIFAHNEDLMGMPAYFKALAAVKVDGLLISDLGVWNLARQTIPEMPLHVSTQANNTNWASAVAWEQMGASRIVLARELSLKEIKEVADHTTVDLETFIHGAMCISYSGRCWLSSYLTGRDGNRGACVQACRWEYTLKEKSRPGQEFDVAEDERGTYVMNSKDLCLIQYLPELIDCGVASFKIEGRMKSAHYVASVVSVYRKAIDSAWENPKAYKVLPAWLEELEKGSHRPYTTGFAIAKPDTSSQEYASSKYIQGYDFVGLVEKYDEKTQRLYIEQRNHMEEGEMLEILQPDGTLVPLKLEQMLDATGLPITTAPHAQEKFSAACTSKILPYSILRRKIM